MIISKDRCCPFNPDGVRLVRRREVSPLSEFGEGRTFCPGRVKSHENEIEDGREQERELWCEEVSYTLAEEP